MDKKNWVFQPHAGHLIVGNECRFHLNTYVGKYLVSTVGEYFPDSQVREIMAKVEKIPLEGKGDARASDFLRKKGFVEIGCGRLYETMVFRAIKRKDVEDKCCPYGQKDGRDLDFAGYNDRADAFKGHYEMCKKWSKK